MRLKIEVQNSGSEDARRNHTITRLPSAEALKEAIENYIHTGNGAVILHSSLYDYRYDTKLADYHKVDSISIAGHIFEVTVENGIVYVNIELNDDININKKYICFYRATMESDPNLADRTLVITNLFSVDLITVLDSELSENTNLSSFEILG